MIYHYITNELNREKYFQIEQISAVIYDEKDVSVYLLECLCLFNQHHKQIVYSCASVNVCVGESLCWYVCQKHYPNIYSIRVIICYKCCILTCIYIYIYTCIYMQNESERHNDKGREKTSLKNILLTLFVSFCVWKGVGDWTRIDLTRPSKHRRVSFSFSWCSTGGQEAHSAGCGLSLPHLVTNWSGPQTPSGVPRAPSAGCGFPYHILSLTHLVSNSLTFCPHWVI